MGLETWHAKQRIQGDATREKIMEAIMDFWKANGFSPSIRDIMEHTSISSTSVVNYHLRILQREGRIRRQLNVSRSITTTSILGVIRAI
jgi:SOS-response transcriptional repressor LexA